MTFQGISTSISGNANSAAVNVAATNPVSVVHGTGAAEMVSIPTAGGSEINIEDAGILLVKIKAEVDVGTERPVPAVAIYAYDAVIGTDEPLEVISTYYLRGSTNDVPVYGGERSLDIATDDTSIKLVWTSVSNSETGTSSFTVDAGMVVTFSRIGVKGEPGPAGAGEENVQSNWGETDPTSDAFVLQKPTIPSITGLQNAAQVNTLIEAYGEPFTSALLTKLSDIEDDAKDDQTGAEIVTLLAALSAGNKLSYNDLDDTPDLTQTTELFSGNVNVTAVEGFVAVGEDIPAAADADWALVQVGPEEDWIPLNLAQLRAKNASTAGSTSASANRLKVHSPDLLETLYFGRTTTDGILFSSSDAEGDGTPFDPSPLVIHTVDKVA